MTLGGFSIWSSALRRLLATPNDLLCRCCCSSSLASKNATGSSRRSCFEGLFKGQKGPATPIATCALPVIRKLLERSDRLTLMTSYELEHENGLLRALPFGAISPEPSIGITTRASWLPTRQHMDFIDLVRAHVAARPDRVVLSQAS